MSTRNDLQVVPGDHLPAEVRGSGDPLVATPFAPEPNSHRTEGLDVEQFADLVAHRVVDLLAGAHLPVSAPLAWTAADVAREVGRSTDWVRGHRHELGLLPASGSRPRLLFDPAAVRAWATACRASNEPLGQEAPQTLGSARRRRAASGSGVDLLPIAGARRAA